MLAPHSQTSLICLDMNPLFPCLRGAICRGVHFMENKRAQVPLLVVSAGITDIVAETLRRNGLLLDNVTVRANTMHFGEDGKLERFRESTPVHSRQASRDHHSLLSQFSSNCTRHYLEHVNLLSFFVVSASIGLRVISPKQERGGGFFGVVCFFASEMPASRSPPTTRS